MPARNTEKKSLRLDSHYCMLGTQAQWFGVECSRKRDLFFLHFLCIGQPVEMNVQEHAKKRECAHTCRRERSLVLFQKVSALNRSVGRDVEAPLTFNAEGPRSVNIALHFHLLHFINRRRSFSKPLEILSHFFMKSNHFLQHNKVYQS